MIDENIFFKNITRLICGDLEIDKALKSCLHYIRDFIPADFMGFVIYLPGQTMIESLVTTTLDDSDTLSVKIPVSVGEKRRLEKGFIEPQVSVSDPANPNDPVIKMAKMLGWPRGRSILIEMVLSGKRMGAMLMINRENIPYSKEHVRLLTLLNEPLGIALTNSLRYKKAQELKNLLLDDKRFLENELYNVNTQEIIGSEFGLKGVMEAVSQVAGLSSPVLLLGETGVGKEVIAKAVHTNSSRRDGPFVKVNCGAFTESLIDSELFGHEKGAFTGAVSLKRGRFERAHQGSIFLDEIGELPMEAQIRLLRVLQDKQFERVGGEETLTADCRIIAATNRNLDEMISEKQFREDLYFRLKVFPIKIPPLRERKSDIPALVQHFMQQKAREIALRGIPTLAPGAIETLIDYDWPGNVRELENTVERALIIHREKPLQFTDIIPKTKPSNRSEALSVNVHSVSHTAGLFPTLDSNITAHIVNALKLCGGRVEGRYGAAILLNVKPATLRQKMRKLNIPFGRKFRHLYNSDG